MGDYGPVNSQFTTVAADRSYADMRMEVIKLEETWFRNGQDASREIKVAQFCAGIGFQKGERLVDIDCIV